MVFATRFKMLIRLMSAWCSMISPPYLGFGMFRVNPLLDTIAWTWAAILLLNMFHFHGSIFSNKFLWEDDAGLVHPVSTPVFPNQWSVFFNNMVHLQQDAAWRYRIFKVRANSPVWENSSTVRIRVVCLKLWKHKKIHEVWLLMCGTSLLSQDDF